MLRDQWLLVRLQSQDGLSGWGEITGSCDDSAVASLLSDLTESLSGKNLLAIKDCCSLLENWRYPVVRTIRTVSTALSGLNQALWDLTARYYNVPLYKLYGADGVDSIPLYANLNKALWGDRSPDSLQRNGAAALAEGFSMVKCTPFDEVIPTQMDPNMGPAMDRIQALAEAVPFAQIAIDCHQRFQGYTLERAVEAITRRWGIPYWMEDPVPADDFASMKRARASFPTVRWAAGEDSLCPKAMMTLANSGCYEILMPDVKYIGGPDAVRALIPVLESLNFKMTLHNPNGIIATAHSAHLSALIGSGAPMEYPYGAVEQRELLCEPVEQIRKGRYYFLDNPGIGLDLSEQTLARYGTCFRDGRWTTYKGDSV